MSWMKKPKEEQNEGLRDPSKIRREGTGQ